MAVGQFADPIAQRVLELQKISATQWLLRGIGAAASVGALMLALGTTALFAHFPIVVLTLVVLIGVLLQCWRPDSDMGLLAPGATLFALLVQGDLSLLRAAATGIVLLLAHSAFALASTIPVQGELGWDAWLLALRGLLPVVLLTAVAGALVALLSAVQLGPWMLVVGVLAAIALFIAVLPRSR